MSDESGQDYQLTDRASVHQSVQRVTTGTMINRRWYLMGMLGEGTYGTVYQAYDYQTKLSVAVKVENDQRKSKAKLVIETDVLRKLQGSRYAAAFVGYGVINDTRYLVMSLLGPDIGRILKCQPGQRFTCSDAAQLGVKMLPAIQSVHNVGYIHRDIKPPNFALNSYYDPDNIVIFDFGAVRQYVDKDGKVVEPRSVVNFTGNPLYASCHALSGINENQIPVGSEQCRRDDLWSLLYAIVSFFTGSLPWMFAEDWHTLIYVKRQTQRNVLLYGLRNEYYQFYDYISMLRYDDEPNYVFLQALLNSVYKDYSTGKDSGFNFQYQNL